MNFKSQEGYLDMEGSQEEMPSGNGYMKMRPSLFDPGEEEIKIEKDDPQSTPKKRNKSTDANNSMEKLPMLDLDFNDHSLPMSPPVPKLSPESPNDGYIEPLKFEKNEKDKDTESKASKQSNAELLKAAAESRKAARDHFLGEGRTHSPVRLRTNPNQPLVDSVASDASSGFHSDYIPDDSVPPEYNNVMKGVYMNQRNDYVNNNPHETSV